MTLSTNFDLEIRWPHPPLKRGETHCDHMSRGVEAFVIRMANKLTRHDIAMSSFYEKPVIQFGYADSYYAAVVARKDRKDYSNSTPSDWLDVETLVKQMDIKLDGMLCLEAQDICIYLTPSDTCEIINAKFKEALQNRNNQLAKEYGTR